MDFSQHFSEEDKETAFCSSYDHLSICNTSCCGSRNSPSQGLFNRPLNKEEHSEVSPIQIGLKQYKEYFGMNKLLRESAIMDFNNIQSLYKNDYREVLRWWKQMSLSKQSKCFRDQPLKWFMWSMIALPDPQLSKQRIESSKVIALIYVIDDIFDVLGSLEELERFTQIVGTWDNSQIFDSLPIYMKICYDTLCNTTNEIASLVMKEYGWNPIDSLRKSWTSLFKAFLVEARWFRQKSAPKAKEYLENAIISSGVQVALVHLHFLLGDEGSQKTSALLNEDMPQVFYQTALILRLWDDLGSAKDENQEGFDGSYVDYYMKEHAVSSKSARKHTKQMISDAHKRLNKELLSSDQFSSTMKQAILNAAEMMKVMHSIENQMLE